MSGEDPKNKAGMLSLIANIYKQRMDLTTNAGVIQESLSLVETAKNEILGKINQEKSGV